MPYTSKLAIQIIECVIIFFAGFTEESSLENKSKLTLCKWSCSCNESPVYRVPICCCQTNRVSPFLQIRWKRIVIDENLHSSESENLSTTLMSCARLISAERRWIVTGTLTTKLSGLCLGSRLDTETTRETMRLMQASGRNSAASNASTSRDSDKIHGKWSENDRKTLIKLGNMIISIIRMPQFHNNPGEFSTYVIKPLLDNEGPKPGSVQVLDQIMKMIMVRYR